MPQNKVMRFGQVREIPADAAESRRIPFILSTGIRDRYGTVLNQENWSLDNYRKNPVVGYMHNLYGDFCNPPDPDRVIGKDTGIEIVETKEGKILMGVPEFEPADINPLAEKIFRKILFGTLSTSSVGFMETGKGKKKDEDLEDGTTQETYYFSGQELLEYSIVNIPGNPDATKQKELRLRSLREQTHAAILYAYRELGGKLRFSQIEELRVRDVLDLLECKDLGIETSDPDKARKAISEAANARIRLLKLNSQ